MYKKTLTCIRPTSLLAAGRSVPSARVAVFDFLVLCVFLMCESLTFSYLRDRHYALHLFIFSVGPHSYAFLVYGSISPNFRVLSVSELITLLASSPAFWCIDISKTSQGQTFGVLHSSSIITDLVCTVTACMLLV